MIAGTLLNRLGRRPKWWVICDDCTRTTAVVVVIQVQGSPFSILDPVLVSVDEKWWPVVGEVDPSKPKRRPKRDPKAPLRKDGLW